MKKMLTIPAVFIVLAGLMICGVISAENADQTAGAEAGIVPYKDTTKGYTVDDYVRELEMTNAMAPGRVIDNVPAWITYTNPDKAGETGFIGFMPEGLPSVAALEGQGSSGLLPSMKPVDLPETPDTYPPSDSYPDRKRLP